MFDKFVNRYIIEGELVACTAFHIGAAENTFRPGGCKNPFFRNAVGLPLIPGSSLKGAMRSFLEQYLSTEAGKDVIPSNIYYRRDICNEQSPCGCSEKDKKELKELLKSKEIKSQKKLSETLFGNEETGKKGKLCIICRLFGSQYNAAKFSVRDAGVIDKTFQREFEIRSGVAIDRSFGTGIDGQKFEIEVVPEGTKFSFQAVLENGDETEHKVINQLFQAMKLGMIPIGGMKSRGLGDVRLQNLKYKYINEKNIAAYLSGKEIKSEEFN